MLVPGIPLVRDSLVVDVPDATPFHKAIVATVIELNAISISLWIAVVLLEVAAADKRNIAILHDDIMAVLGVEAHPGGVTHVQVLARHVTG